ncbi:MAG TPA: FHA domain-containing protein [Thermoanaerobaculia bacterium]|jgi:hypothetical protein|nr:FHA domain-containing protein [Thermoanaerobaculia bacterium]
MPFLVEHPADSQAPAARVEGDELLIGRGTNAGLRLDDSAVALEHARIERSGDGYRLQDLGSDTGTYLNGRPVGSATYLKDGDTIGLGGTQAKVRWRSPADPLVLEVRPVVEEVAAPIAGPAAIKVPKVDYLRAYALRRPFLTKGLTALLLTLAAAGVLAALPRLGLWQAFQPGPVSAAHQLQQVGCFGCHTPWKGPAAVNCASASCHPRLDHQARQAFTPACADCHFEHRGQASLTRVNNASCVTCHGDLKVKSGEPAFARRVTAFPEGHADFSLTLPEGGRLPVAEAVARRVDLDTVRLNHALHLAPGLLSPEGRVTLVCQDCHQPGPGPTGMTPVSFARHCDRCHRLTFDPALPEEEAPHAEPRTVHNALLAAYSVNEGQMGSYRERRRIIVRNPGAAMGLDLSARVRGQVVEAESLLYRSACAKCHVMDLNARPFPAVARVSTPGEWLPLSRFTHGDHVNLQGLTCEACHGRAAASTATADLLLPGIEACGGCHGGHGRPPGNAALKAGPRDCLGCHTYHPAKGRI